MRHVKQFATSVIISEASILLRFNKFTVLHVFYYHFMNNAREKQITNGKTLAAMKNLSTLGR